MSYSYSRPKSAGSGRRSASSNASNFNYRNFSNLSYNTTNNTASATPATQNSNQPTANANGTDHWSTSYKLHFGYQTEAIQMGMNPNILMNSSSANNIGNKNGPGNNLALNATAISGRPQSASGTKPSGPGVTSSIGNNSTSSGAVGPFSNKGYGGSGSQRITGNTEKFPPVTLQVALQQQQSTSQQHILGQHNMQNQQQQQPNSSRSSQAERIRKVIASNRAANASAAAVFKEELNSEQQLQKQYEQQLASANAPIPSNSNTSNNKHTVNGPSQQQQQQQMPVIHIGSSMAMGMALGNTAPVVVSVTNTDSGTGTGTVSIGNTTYHTINTTDIDNDYGNKSVASTGAVGTGAVGMLRGAFPGASGIEEGPVVPGTLIDDDEMDGKRISSTMLGMIGNANSANPMNLPTSVTDSRSYPEVNTPSLTSLEQSGANISLTDGRNNSTDSFTDEFIDLGLTTVPNQFCTIRDGIELKKMLLLTHGVRGGMVPSATSVMDMYMVGKVIGVGSYGKVRAAWHRLTAAKVAIKTYDKSKMKDDSHWKRVHSEIKIMEQVSHPRIARMYEAIETPKRMHLIMECLEGSNLCSHVKAKKRLTEDEARGIFFQLIQAIDYIHNLNVTHRDIKLENILFTSSKSTDLKLIDFGFSTVCQPGKKLKVFCGTPSYMAPEIVRRTEYEGKPVDMWSMGILLYALLCGCFPFRAKSYPDLYRRIARGTFVIPEDIGSSVRDLISQLLEVDATRRVTSNIVLRHPWLQTALYAAPDMKKLRGDTPILISDRPADDLDEGVLKELDKFGMPRDELVRLILSKLHSSLTTFYYLLYDITVKKRRKGGYVPPPSTSGNGSNKNVNTTLSIEKLSYNYANSNNNTAAGGAQSSGNISSRSAKSAGAVPSRGSAAITITPPQIASNTVNSIREKPSTATSAAATAMAVTGGEYANYMQQLQQQQQQQRPRSASTGTNNRSSSSSSSNNTVNATAVTATMTPQQAYIASLGANTSNNSNNTNTTSTTNTGGGGNTGYINTLRSGYGMQRPLSAYMARR